MAKIGDAVIKNLGTFLSANMALLQDVQYEFPAPNQALKYPSMSIFQQNPKFTPMPNYVFGKGDEILTGPDAGKTPIKRVVGQYDFSIQLDFWCRSKFERENVLEQFHAAMSKNPDVSGISLQMADYHGVWIHYDLSAYNYVTDDADSTRSEWRGKVDIVANCFAISEGTDYVIETIENNLEFPQVIDDGPSSPSGGLTI